MVGIDGRRRIDLKTVVLLAGVLEQAVHWVQHVMGKQEEPLPKENTHTHTQGINTGHVHMLMQ